MRDPEVQVAINAIERAFRKRIQPGTPIAVLADHIFDATTSNTGGTANKKSSEALPVCHHLAPALVHAASGTRETAAVADAFSSIMHRLTWQQRPASPTDATGFADNHANTLIAGPGGLEERADMRIGASLVAPQTRYPDHSHPPEEMYLVLSEGEWRNAETPWHSPGIGGVVHNAPGIVHAMRSAEQPLFAIWCLWHP